MWYLNLEEWFPLSADTLSGDCRTSLPWQSSPPLVKALGFLDLQVSHCTVEVILLSHLWQIQHVYISQRNNRRENQSQTCCRDNDYISWLTLYDLFNCLLADMVARVSCTNFPFCRHHICTCSNFHLNLFNKKETSRRLLTWIHHFKNRIELTRWTIRAFGILNHFQYLILSQTKLDLSFCSTRSVTPSPPPPPFLSSVWTQGCNTQTLGLASVLLTLFPFVYSVCNMTRSHHFLVLFVYRGSSTATTHIRLANCT